MLSYAHGGSPVPLLGESIHQNLRRTIERVPDADALISRHQGIRYTYAEFGQAVRQVAAGMWTAGLRPGDRAGVWGPNRAEWALVQYATACIGVILVNINPAYRASELEYALGQSGCRHLFAAQECRGTDFVDMANSVKVGLPALERAIFFDTDEWHELADTPEDDLPALPEQDFDDPINIQYTSGTTGFPKGATLTHHNILNNGRLLAELLDYSRTGPRVRARAPVPLLRDGDRQPGLHEQWSGDRLSGRVV